MVTQVHRDILKLEISIWSNPTAKEYNAPRQPCFPAVYARVCQLQTSNGTNASAPRWRASTIHNASIRLPDIAARIRDRYVIEAFTTIHSNIGVRVLFEKSTVTTAVIPEGVSDIVSMRREHAANILLWQLFLLLYILPRGAFFPLYRNPA